MHATSTAALREEGQMLFPAVTTSLVVTAILAGAAADATWEVWRG